jgi:hypothetical protein
MRLRVGSMAVHLPSPKRVIVSAYKAMGFVILTAILVGLTSYIAVDVFFFFNRSWVAPTILSASDPHVADLNGQLAQQASLRDKLRAERRDLVVRLSEAGRVIKAEADFQARFALALKADLDERRHALHRFAKLGPTYKAARDEITKANEAFAALSKERMHELFAAKIIDEDEFVGGNHRLAEIANDNLSLTQHSVELDQRLAGLRRDVRSFEAAQRALAAHTTPAAAVLGYEALLAKRELDRSNLAADKAEDTVRAVTADIAALDSTLARYDRLLASIERSPYLQATEKEFMVAFVPYENLANVEPGDGVYGCRLTFVLCRRVGRVAEVLGGEVTRKHPVHSQEMRGVMVHIVLDEPKMAEKAVLHIGRAPVFL